jgi:hypothetical protein
LLEQIGLESRRVQMINLSSAMGGQFAFSAAELTAEIKQLGPNPLNTLPKTDESSSNASLRGALSSDEAITLSTK